MGQSISSTGFVYNPFRYISDYFDGDLYQLGARYYDQGSGRFTQLDPIADAEPYAYAGDNPVNYSDPDGLCTRTLSSPQANCSGGGYTAYVNQPSGGPVNYVGTTKDLPHL